MTNRNARVLRRLIREHDPDVILTVETDEWWMQELAELERTHPYTVKQPQLNTYGMLLYSRLELHDVRLEFLVQDDIPSIHTHVRLRAGSSVELHGLHPRPPAPQESDRTTERDAELLIVAKQLKGKDARAIVAGDLNDVAWSHTNSLFQKVSGLLNPHDGRALSLGAGVLLDAGQTGRALEWSRRCLDLYPDDASALVNIACVYARMNLNEEALRLLERVFAQGCGKRDWVLNCRSQYLI